MAEEQRDRRGWLEERLVRGFARTLGVKPDANLRRYVRDGGGRLPAGARLLLWEANSIHAFVFDSLNATGIRGASAILREIDIDLARAEALGLDPGQVLYAGGGSGVAVAAPDQVDGAIARLHELFARRTLVATCSAVAVDLDPDRGFGEMVGAAGAALGRERLLGGPDPEPDVPFFAERCAVCGRRAAAVRQPRGPERRLRPECTPCNLRIDRGRQRYPSEPSDFEAVTDKQGYLAVVYLDGNGVGRAIRGLRSPLDYAGFSAAMAQVVRRSFDDQAIRYRVKAGGRPPAGGDEIAEDEAGESDSYQLPICAGDDLVAILPGEIALPLTRDLVAGFERAAAADPHLEAAKLGASAGIALARSGLPVRNLLDEAEELLKIAKRRIYSEDGGGSALAFAVVRDGTPRAESLEPERWRRGSNELLASGMPYTLEEFERLSSRRRVIEAADVGRSQLFALRRVAERGEAQLRSHVLYQVGRSREWQELVRTLAAGEGDPLVDATTCFDCVIPRYGGRRVCDIADLIAVMPHWREADEPERERRA